MLDHEMTPHEILNAIEADLQGATYHHWKYNVSEREKMDHVRIVQSGLDDIAGRQHVIELEAERAGQ